MNGRGVRKADFWPAWPSLVQLPDRRPHSTAVEFTPARLFRIPRRSCRTSSIFLKGLTSCILGASLSVQTTLDTSWSHYGGDAGGMRYSRLTQISPENVSMRYEKLDRLACSL